ncbi:MAG TPA: U32 family peptidase [Rubrivivax sp.]|nr:U32 family peptidase [Rubrivivax sp.]
MSHTTTGPLPVAPRAAMHLHVGPLLYFWPREAVLHFYAGLADSPASGVVLGEVVCERRRDLKPDDWLALAREMASAGKEVTLATQALIQSEADLRLLRKVADSGDFVVEAGDVSAVALLEQAGGRFVLGPHINVYSRAALAEYVRVGAERWVAPIELPLDAVARINTPQPLLPTEVFAFGRMPLAFSARCFTARHHRLSKDDCQFRCKDDADGLLLSTTDGQPFLVLNGIQTQSAGTQCLIGEGAALRAAGVTRLRLSPCASGFDSVLEQFDAVFNRGQPAAEALDELRRHALPGGLVGGFAHGHAGLEEATA